MFVLFRREQDMSRGIIECVNKNNRTNQSSNNRRNQRSNNRRKKIVAIQKFVLSISIVVLLISTMFLFNPFTSLAKEQDNLTLYKYYNSVIVGYNDSLSSIATQYCDLSATNYDSYIKEVCEINHLQDPDDLVAGNYIVVPYYSYEFQ